MKEHSSRLRKIGACLHQLLKPEEREFVVDSGASMHMISKKDLNSAEIDTFTKSCSPTIVITANGEVQTHEEATVYVKELEKFLTMKVLENTPAVLSLGKLCINGQKPHLTRGSRLVSKFFLQFSFFNFHDTFKTGKWSSCIFLKLVYFTNHNRVKRQRDSNKGWSEWDRFPSSTCVKFTCWTNRTGWPVVAQANRKSKNKLKTKTTI